MLLPKGMNAKTVREKLPPWKALIGVLARTRFWLVVIVGVVVILLLRGFASSAKDMQRYVSFKRRVYAFLPRGTTIYCLTAMQGSGARSANC